MEIVFKLRRQESMTKCAKVNIQHWEVYLVTWESGIIHADVQNVVDQSGVTTYTDIICQTHPNYIIYRWRHWPRLAGPPAKPPGF